MLVPDGSSSLVKDHGMNGHLRAQSAIAVNRIGTAAMAWPSGGEAKLQRRARSVRQELTTVGEGTPSRIDAASTSPRGLMVSLKTTSASDSSDR